MKEQIISFETAKFAKELGFPSYIVGTGFYNLRTKNYIHFGRTGKQCHKKHMCTAPTQSMLQNWLREREIIVSVDPVLKTNKFYYCSYAFFAGGTGHYLFRTEFYESWERSLEVGLKLALISYKEINGLE